MPAIGALTGGRRGGRLRIAALLGGLVALHYAIRPFVSPRMGPDLVLLALLLLAMSARPGVGAAAGLIAGLAMDAVAPTAFGAGALSMTLAGYVAGWLKAVVFADNLMVTSLFVVAVAWGRDVIQVLASNQLEGAALAWQLLVFSPVSGVATAACGFVVLAVFRGWLEPARQR